MKAVIFAGGFGTRISEESRIIPKPLIEIGGNPIIWHIMKTYASYGITDFVICAGYKQNKIKEYFFNYTNANCDVTFDYTTGDMQIHKNNCEPWKVTIVDTGLNTMTGGRLKRIQKYLDDEAFCLTYGDGVSDVPIDEVIKYHRNRGKILTLVSVRPEGRFGTIDISENSDVIAFREKDIGDTGWINGGYMVVDPKVFDYIGDSDDIVFEKQPLTDMVRDNQVDTYRYDGFWQCMDTLKDKEKLEMLWSTGKAPWKKW